MEENLLQPGTPNPVPEAPKPSRKKLYIAIGLLILAGIFTFVFTSSGLFKGALMESDDVIAKLTKRHLSISPQITDGFNTHSTYTLKNFGSQSMTIWIDDGIQAGLTDIKTDELCESRMADLEQSGKRKDAIVPECGNGILEKGEECDEFSRDCTQCKLTKKRVEGEESVSQDLSSGENIILHPEDTTGGGIKTMTPIKIPTTINIPSTRNTLTETSDTRPTNESTQIPYFNTQKPYMQTHLEDTSKEKAIDTPTEQNQCGNGILEPDYLVVFPITGETYHEECDDGGVSDTCSKDCRLRNKNLPVESTTETVVDKNASEAPAQTSTEQSEPNHCGNGKIEREDPYNEECDDPTDIDGKVCMKDCKLNPEFLKFVEGKNAQANPGSANIFNAKISSSIDSPGPSAITLRQCQSVKLEIANTPGRNAVNVRVANSGQYEIDILGEEEPDFDMEADGGKVDETDAPYCGNNIKDRGEVCDEGGKAPRAVGQCKATCDGYATAATLKENPSKKDPVTQCNDGKDNDGDGKIDLKDAGCIDALDDDEENHQEVITKKASAKEVVSKYETAGFSCLDKVKYIKYKDLKNTNLSDDVIDTIYLLSQLANEKRAIVIGYDADDDNGRVFKADSNIRRDEAAKIAYVGTCFESFLDATNNLRFKSVGYKDISSKDWSVDIINAMTNADIIGGYSDNKFHPEQNVSRAEFIKILVDIYLLENPKAKFTKYDPKKYDFWDVDEKDWHKDYMATAFELGIVKGFKHQGQYVLNPDFDLTRAEAAVLMNNFLANTLDLDFDDLDL